MKIRFPPRLVGFHRVRFRLSVRPLSVSSRVWFARSPPTSELRNKIETRKLQTSINTFDAHGRDGKSGGGARFTVVRVSRRRKSRLVYDVVVRVRSSFPRFSVRETYNAVGSRPLDNAETSDFFRLRSLEAYSCSRYGWTTDESNRFASIRPRIRSRPDRFLRDSRGRRRPGGGERDGSESFPLYIPCSLSARRTDYPATDPDATDVEWRHVRVFRARKSPVDVPRNRRRTRRIRGPGTLGFLSITRVSIALRVGREEKSNYRRTHLMCIMNKTLYTNIYIIDVCTFFFSLCV